MNPYRTPQDQDDMDKMAGKLVFCYVMIAGLSIIIGLLLYLWPH